MNETSPEAVIPAETPSPREVIPKPEKGPTPESPKKDFQALEEVRQELAQEETQVPEKPAPPFTSADFGEDYFHGQGSNYKERGYEIYDNDGFWETVTGFVRRNNLEGRALDVGCAYGYLLKRLASEFDPVCGLDISHHALQKATALQRAGEVPSSAKFIQADLSQDSLPFPDNHFDLITALDVLEHTPSVEESLKRLARVLKKDGFLIVEIPVRETLLAKIRQRFGFEKDRTHISIPIEEEFLQAIAAAGLKVKESSYFLHWPQSKPKMPSFLSQRGIKIFNNLEVVLQKKEAEPDQSS